MRQKYNQAVVGQKVTDALDAFKYGSGSNLAGTKVFAGPSKSASKIVWALHNLQAWVQPDSPDTVFVTVDSSLAEKLHPHDYLRYVGIRHFGNMYWFQVEAECKLLSSERFEITGRKLFWSRMSSFAVEPTKLESVFARPWLLGKPDSSTFYYELIMSSTNIQLANTKLESKTLSGHSSWVDLHNLYFHPEVFAVDQGMPGVPEEHLKKLFDVPAKLIMT